MKTSQSIQNLTKALLVAQTQMGAATKGAKNPFFKSSYADLPTVMEVVKEPLNNAGIIVLQPATHQDGKNFITTTLLHADTGEWMESQTEVVCAKQNDPQAFGAAQTYARRFGLQSMLFIPAEDDDGNFASGRTPANIAKNNNVTTVVNTPVTPTTPTPVLATTTPTTGISTEPFKKTSSFSKKKKEATTTTVVDTTSAATQASEW